MKKAGFILVWLAALAASAQTNQGWQICRDPVRVFGSHVVNLAPLFQWWTRQTTDGKAAGFTSATIDIDTNDPDVTDRPLAAWHRVTGPHVGTLYNGSWVVDATIYTSPTSRTNARIILNRPPTGEEQNYYTLKAELEQTAQQITNAGQAYKADVKAEQKYQQRSTAYARSNTKVALDGYRDYAALAAQKENAVNTDADQQKQLETLRNQIEAQLKTIPAVKGVYQVDWFALMVGRTKQGLPVYDLGVVSTSPP